VTVFTEERDLALKTRRCMACNEKLHEGQHKLRVVCGNGDCMRYYHQLYDNQPEQVKRKREVTRVVRARAKARGGK
jgi:cyclopropane fatty-acyl-phospholipid synthase-like methyltransferase